MRCQSRRSRLVLILVLVDVGLGHNGSWNVTTHIESLNPCFSGCWSRTLKSDAHQLFQKAS